MNFKRVPKGHLVWLNKRASRFELGFQAYFGRPSTRKEMAGGLDCDGDPFDYSLALKATKPPEPRREQWDTALMPVSEIIGFAGWFPDFFDREASEAELKWCKARFEEDGWSIEECIFSLPDAAKYFRAMPKDQGDDR